MKTAKRFQNLVCRFLLLFTILGFLFFVPPSLGAANLETISAPNEIAILKARVDTLENLNERILNSVYWTLGTLAAIFLGLISVNLYINISANKREIKNIKTDLVTSTENSIATSETKILKELTEQNQKEFESIRVEVLGTTRNELTASEATVLEKVSQLNQKEFESIRVEVLGTARNEILVSESKMTEKITSLDKSGVAEIEKLKRSLEVIKDQFIDIQVTVKELEVDRFAAKGQQGQIIRLVDLLKISIDRNETYQIPRRLTNIRDYVKDTELRSHVAADLNKQLARLEAKSEYKPQVEEITGLIKTFID